MATDLPSFKKPPVVETAISVQFNRIQGFSNAHLGLFWDQIRDAYPTVLDAEPIAPQIEKFGEDVGRRPRLPGFRITPTQAAARLQMISEDGAMMVQLQNGRLVFNWRRIADQSYPRWRNVFPRFESAFSSLAAFLEAKGLHAVEPNQWEVTYVNHLPRSRDWNTPEDWPVLLPGIIGTGARASVGDAESIDCKYRLVLPEERGRLHAELFHGFTGAEEDAMEVLVFQLTARGGVVAGDDLTPLLSAGHEAIIRTFAEFTGSQAHKRWERER